MQLTVNLYHKLLKPFYLKHEDSLDRIEGLKFATNYWNSYNSKEHNHVLYTCIVGNYDRLVDHKFLNFDFDYICFTDNENLLTMKTFGAWQIKPLQIGNMPNNLINRWHKMNPHLLFQNKSYKDSIYIDSNINILTNYLFETIEENKNKSLLIPKHFKNDCIYKEAKYILKCKKASKAKVSQVVTYLQENNFPKNYGLSENHIIYRKHNEAPIIKIMNEWWDVTKKLESRDQLTLFYILWKNNVQPSNIYIRNAGKDEKNYRIYSHYNIC